MLFWEILITVGVYMGVYLEWKHYQLALTKKQREQLNRKLNRLVSYAKKS
jgi:hypothetical protein